MSESEFTPGENPSVEITPYYRRRLARQAVAAAVVDNSAEIATSPIDDSRRVTREVSSTLNELLASEKISARDQEMFAYLLGYIERPRDVRARTVFRVDFGAFMHKEYKYLVNKADRTAPCINDYAYLFVEGKPLGSKALESDKGPYSFSAIAEKYAKSQRPTRTGRYASAVNSQLAQMPVDSVELLKAKTILRDGTVKYLRARYELDD